MFYCINAWNGQTHFQQNFQNVQVLKYIKCTCIHKTCREHEIHIIISSLNNASKSEDILVHILGVKTFYTFDR